MPELGTIRAAEPPIVIITTNRTREVHDALKRRCLYHWVDYPEGRAGTARSSAARCPAATRRCRGRSSPMCRSSAPSTCSRIPGVAETIDWATALTELDRTALDPETVSDTLGHAAEIPGRHRPHRGRRRTQAAGRGEVRAARGGLTMADGGDRTGRLRRRCRRATAASPTTSSISPARCARPGLRIGPGRRGGRDRSGRGDRASASATNSTPRFYCTLVTRHEDQPIFDEAFRLFWRSRDLVQKMIAMMSPVVRRDTEKERRKAGETRVSDALFAGQAGRRAAAGRTGDRDRCPLHRLRQRGAAQDRLRPDDGGRAARGQARDRKSRAADGRGQDAPLPPQHRQGHDRSRGRRCARRCARAAR